MNSNIEFKFIKESSIGLKYSLKVIGKFNSGETKYKIIRQTSKNIDSEFCFYLRESLCILIFKKTLNNPSKNERLLVLESPIEIKCDDETDFLTNNFVNCVCFIAEQYHPKIYGIKSNMF